MGVKTRPNNGFSIARPEVLEVPKAFTDRAQPNLATKRTPDIEDPEGLFLRKILFIVLVLLLLDSALLLLGAAEVRDGSDIRDKLMKYVTAEPYDHE
ncbi:MAG: hypothetical protein H0W76_08845 [Pyrinomonadaceae bacterium]|nr:hypothetical protein [Pyrinomonadaceae bacterium]